MPPTLEEIRLILRALDESNPDLGALVYVALTTGCRRGELCGLPSAANAGVRFGAARTGSAR